jgi:HlyD family secretion protein
MMATARFMVVAAATVWLAGCANGQPADAAKRATGYVEATEVRVASRIPGRVLDVQVTEGQRIEAGAAVVTLSTAELDLAVARTRAERAQADAQVRLLLSGARPEDITQAEAQLAAARSDREAADAEQAAAAADEARFEQLLQRRAGSAKQRDDARARRVLAQARARAASDRSAAAAAALARLRAGTRAEEIEAARARLASVDAQLATLEHDRDEARVTSPVAGIVSSRLVEPGELIPAGAPVAVVVDLDRAWVNAYVEEPLVPSLRVGEATTVVTDGGDQVAGTVAFVAPRAEFTPRNVQTTEERARLVYRVRINVDNRSGVLKPGMPVEVTWSGAN